MPMATAALGQDANQAAAEAANPVKAPAPCSTAAPIGAHRALAASPANPATSAADTTGPTTRFATGDTSETIPNVPTMIGSVVIVAQSVSAKGAQSQRSHTGTATTSHASASRANKTSPATADTDRPKPRSKALSGDATSTAVAASTRDVPPSTRRPENHAAATATVIAHARTADGWTPESTTYPPTTAPTIRTCTPLASRIALRTQPTTAATTTRWLPDTATRCVSPVSLKSASAWEPAKRRVSPTSTPASKSPPTPGTRARVSHAHTRTGPINPRTESAHPRSATCRARRRPTTPDR